MFVSDDNEQEKYNYLHMFKMDALNIPLSLFLFCVIQRTQ
jgi:hypothetical protein